MKKKTSKVGIGPFEKEVVQRLTKVETNLENLTNSINSYTKLQAKHTEIDSKRLDAVENEVQFWKKLFTRASFAAGFVATLVGLYYKFKG